MASYSSNVMYSELFEQLNVYIKLFDDLYKLKTKNEEEISGFSNLIKETLIDTKIFSFEDIVYEINKCILANNRNLNSYLAILKHLYDQIHPKNVRNILGLMNYLFFKKYVIILDETNSDFEEFEPEEDSDSYLYILDYQLFLYPENTIYGAIMNDDVKSFISHTEEEGFDQNMEIINNLFYWLDQFDGYSLLRLCCYYGAEKCFKFLRTKFHSKITEECLIVSFLGGNQFIINECLKEITILDIYQRYM
ncbi:hypothetical protein TVAG_394420 [Trichomonas vaginalis G3]|uniref:DUF3447 domain-containing protein n=1 Tax=Trichomonas vaginalis (strain ATCC PRA-98 / G3) TaxID=412133 RepID=A2DWF8_TRIV3|nr:protein of unknown function (DUF3447) [Trichomonas vaginalis G3]EAY15298.1 hypothetical protein TVAG_394420 [Trichomonas vaginalis G3]KAI5536596.1 protein of unknown function (DUF3447) [Trichomonas vaginalis G3]|eukprot:XP_001327521.1 hypothetical protein [Trichomonas vaginalis G3]